MQPNTDSHAQGKTGKRLINKSIAPIQRSSPVQTRLYNSHTGP